MIQLNLITSTPKVFSVPISKRFRGYLPVVIDVETGGLNPRTDALLEIAAIPIHMNEEHHVYFNEVWHEHVAPFEGAHLDPKALAFNQIDPHHPFRFAKSESETLQGLFDFLWPLLEETKCTKCILVGHNAFFDLGFLMAAHQRTKIKKNPFHSFTSLDTASLSALCLGHTVLSKACERAHIPYDGNEAHSAVYDARCTAELFCHIVNRWHLLERNLPFESAT